MALDERLFAKFVIEDGCWIWLAARDPNGYGRVSKVTYGQSLAHRVVYEQVIGPIPEGLLLDHLCRNPSCVNPEHLEPVTQKENSYRGVSELVARRHHTHCVHGHPFDEANTYIKKNGTRDCRACHARQERDRQRRVAADLIEKAWAQ